MTDQQRAALMQKHSQYDKDIKQLNIMYMQLATEKSALFRENKNLADKLEKKKVKFAYTEKQLESMIRSYELLKREKDKLEYALGVLKKEVGNEFDSSRIEMRGVVDRNVKKSIKGGGLHRRTLN